MFTVQLLSAHAGGSVLTSVCGPRVLAEAVLMLKCWRDQVVQTLSFSLHLHFSYDRGEAFKFLRV